MRASSRLSAINPYTGLNESFLGTGLGPELQGALVDSVGQKLLHMNSTADPARNPTFTLFGNPNFYFDSFGPAAPVINPDEAWNHGDLQPEIARTFIGIVGPGVRNLGVTETDDFFTDHVDLRPTMLSLLGLEDDYRSDGRVILELVEPNALPPSLRAHAATLRELGQVYKQINSPFGELAKSAWKVSTYALESNSGGDTIYTNLENKIASWNDQRDDIGAKIQSMLHDAQLNGESIGEDQAKQIIGEGRELLDKARDCAADPLGCAY